MSHPRAGSAAASPSTRNGNRHPGTVFAASTPTCRQSTRCASYRYKYLRHAGSRLGRPPIPAPRSWRPFVRRVLRGAPRRPRARRVTGTVIGAVARTVVPGVAVRRSVSPQRPVAIVIGGRHLGAAGVLLVLRRQGPPVAGGTRPAAAARRPPTARPGHDLEHREGADRGDRDGDQDDRARRRTTPGDLPGGRGGRQAGRGQTRAVRGWPGGRAQPGNRHRPGRGERRYRNEPSAHDHHHRSPAPQSMIDLRGRCRNRH